MVTGILRDLEGWLPKLGLWRQRCPARAGASGSGSKRHPEDGNPARYHRVETPGIQCEPITGIRFGFADVVIKRPIHPLVPKVERVEAPEDERRQETRSHRERGVSTAHSKEEHPGDDRDRPARENKRGTGVALNYGLDQLQVLWKIIAFHNGYRSETSSSGLPGRGS